MTAEYKGTIRICPTCQKNGETSKVYGSDIGYETITESGGVGRQSIFYDEEGRRHNHTGVEVCIVTYKCTNGHSFTDRQVDEPKPCWCGWHDKSGEQDD